MPSSLTILGSSARPSLKLATAARLMTRRPLSFESWLVTSSVMPAANVAWPPGEMFSNGSTASRRGGSAAGAALGVAASAGRSRGMPHQSAAAPTTTTPARIAAAVHRLAASRRTAVAAVDSRRSDAVGQRSRARTRDRARSGTGSRASSRGSGESPGRGVGGRSRAEARQDPADALSEWRGAFRSGCRP